MNTISKQTQQSKSNNLTYKESGVDIDAGNEVVEVIKPLANATKRPGTIDEIGGFGGLFDLKASGYIDPILVSCTDGVGTKLTLAVEAKYHDKIGIDLVAMCVNDLIVQGAEPLFFLDYIAMNKLDKMIATSIISGVAEGCKIANCSLIGGETAEMGSLYSTGEYDIAGFALGAVERDLLLPRDNFIAGDIIIGLSSSGVHSNGFSLVRKVIKRSQVDINDVSPFDDQQNFRDILLEPTRIYVAPCLAISKIDGVRGLAHITGGGLIENIPRILPNTMNAFIDSSSWEIPEIFSWIAREGKVPSDEMLRTFNCGIGMAIVVSQDSADIVLDELSKHDQNAQIIGELIPNTDEESNVVIDNVMRLFE